MVMISRSPVFSSGVPGLIQVLVAHILSPQGAISTFALPSPRAQFPSMSAAPAPEAASIGPRTDAIIKGLIFIVFLRSCCPASYLCSIV
ncbi:hypothetical protein D3C71_1841030 [compost metagenome]